MLTNGDILLLTLGGIAGAALWSAIGAGLGAIIHNQVGAIIALLAWGLVVDNLLFGLAPSVGRFMPTRARTHSWAYVNTIYSRQAPAPSP